MAQEETSLQANLRPEKAKRMTLESQARLEQIQSMDHEWDRHFQQAPIQVKNEAEIVDHRYIDMLTAGAAIVSVPPRKQYDSPLPKTTVDSHNRERDRKRIMKEMGEIDEGFYTC